MNRVILVARNSDFPRLSGVKPEAGGAAGLRHIPTAKGRQGVLLGTASLNWWLNAVVEVITVASGLAVFGAIAFFFIVIS